MENKPTDLNKLNNTDVSATTITKKPDKPVSPYLSTYRLQAGSFFSIFTRITGIVILLGIIIPIILRSHVDVGLSDYNSYSVIFFFLKSSYSSYAFSTLFVSFILSVLFHIVASTRYLVSRAFWPTPLRKVYDQTQFFIYVPIGLIIPAAIIYLLI